MPCELIEVLLLEGIEPQGGNIRCEWKEQFNGSMENDSKGQGQSQPPGRKKALLCYVRRHGGQLHLGSLVGVETCI